MQGIIELRRAIRLDDIRYDPWGTCTAWHFAVARVLDAMGADVPSEWEFRRSPADRATVEDIAGPEDDDEDDDDREELEYPDADVALMVLSDETDAETLVYWGNVLDRYARLCTHHGRNY